MRRDDVRAALQAIREQAIALASEVERGIDGLSMASRNRLLAAIERIQRDTERGESIMGPPLRPRDILG